LIPENETDTTMNILHIDSSALGDFSASRQLTAAIVAALREAHADTRVAYRDLAAAPLAHVSGPLLQALRAPAGTPPPDGQLLGEVALTNTLVDELLAAGTVVIGAPMYNFSVPSTLKAWIDRIVMAGRTFSYDQNGPKGLAGGRRIIIVSSRGGQIAGQPQELAVDHQEAYLKAVFGLLGIDDITVIRAEGLAMGDEIRNLAMNGALQQAGALMAA
jgi:FMN-dependent NADH-azoreductase